jgi:hypothetical protein
MELDKRLVDDKGGGSEDVEEAAAVDVTSWDRRGERERGWEEWGLKGGEEELSSVWEGEDDMETTLERPV